MAKAEKLSEKAEAVKSGDCTTALPNDISDVSECALSSKLDLEITLLLTLLYPLLLWTGAVLVSLMSKD